MKYSNFRLATKLGLAFGVVLAVIAASFAFVFFQTERLSEIDRLSASSDAAIDIIDQMSGNLNAARAAVRKFVLTGAPRDEAKVVSSIADVTQDITTLQADLGRDGPEFLPDLLAYRAAVDIYVDQAIHQQQILASDPATRPQAIALTTSAHIKTLVDPVDQHFATLRKKISVWSVGLDVAGKNAMAQTEWVVVASAILAMSLGAIMCWQVARAIGRPLNGMTEAMKALARGDHSIVVPARGQTNELGDMAAAVQVFKEAAIEKIRLETEAAAARRAAEDERSRNEAVRQQAADQIEQVVQNLAGGLNKLATGDLIYRLSQPFSADYESLRENYNATVAQLQDTIKIVSQNTGAIRSGTDQISTASDDLSRRTEQQAASLEETAAALSEISTGVKKTAEGASHAREVVKQATADAQRSGEVVSRTVAAMNSIEKSSQQIGSIIGVIDEIAFQTNLLALNAGVEAARAGDAGRGFAVVASEVRALAQRSAEAAKEIKTLIVASDEEVKAGVRLVGETGVGLHRIIEQVTEISSIINEIATSASHQATGMAEVNIAVRQMDQVTQQNAAMVEEATAATHSLASDSAQLAHAVGRFQIGGGSADTAPVRALRVAAKAPPRTLSRGNTAVAASRPQAAASQDTWEEF